MSKADLLPCVFNEGSFEAITGGEPEQDHPRERGRAHTYLQTHTLRHTEWQPFRVWTPTKGKRQSQLKSRCFSNIPLSSTLLLFLCTCYIPLHLGVVCGSEVCEDDFNPYFSQHADFQSCLICVARRVPVKERPVMPAYESFTTRQDLQGRTGGGEPDSDQCSVVPIYNGVGHIPFDKYVVGRLKT